MGVDRYYQETELRRVLLDTADDLPIVRALSWHEVCLVVTMMRRMVTELVFAFADHEIRPAGVMRMAENGLGFRKCHDQTRVLVRVRNLIRIRDSRDVGISGLDLSHPTEETVKV